MVDDRIVMNADLVENKVCKHMHKRSDTGSSLPLQCKNSKEEEGGGKPQRKVQFNVDSSSNSSSHRSRSV